MRLRLIMLAGFVGLLGFVMPSDQVIKNAEYHFVAQAEAIVGRPLTPVSYAGVARRTAVRRY